LQASLGEGARMTDREVVGVVAVLTLASWSVA